MWLFKCTSVKGQKKVKRALNYDDMCDKTILIGNPIKINVDNNKFWIFYFDLD